MHESVGRGNVRGCYPSINSLLCGRGEGGVRRSSFCLKLYQRAERRYFTCKLSTGERRGRGHDSANVSLLIGLCMGTGPLRVFAHGFPPGNSERR